MSCATKQSVNKDLKNLILVENWAEIGIKSKLNTSSAKSSSYTDGRIEIFIPYDPTNPNKNVLFGKLKNLESQINDKYKSEKYGSIVSIQQPKDGMVISISSTNKLIDALNQQYDGQRNIPDMYFYSRENENTQQDFKYTEPIGDNYVELVNWKKEELENTEKKIHNQKVSLKTQDTTHNRNVLKELEQKEQKLKNQLTALSENKIDFMFHAIYEDLADMKAALESSSLHNIEEIRNRIKFYENFSKSLGDYREEYDKIAGIIKDFVDSYDRLRIEKVKNTLENDISIQNTLKELNKDKNLKIQFDKKLIENELDEEGNPKYEDFEIEDLLVAVSDISSIDRNFLGIISSTTGDTVLPQFLMKEFRETLFKKQHAVRQLIDELDSFVAKTGIKDRDFLFSKDKSGKLDGFLVDVFTNKWFKQYTNLYNKVKIFSSSTKLIKPKSYIQVKNWFDSHTHVIDFTRLNIVKEIYGENSEYKKYFTHSEKNMNKYEENIKKQLGPRYNNVIEKLLNKLEKLEEFKRDNVGNNFYEKNLAQRNLWELLNKWKNKDNSPISYTYTDKNGNKVGSREYFSNFFDIPILPVSQIRDEHTNEIIESEYYNKDFDKVKENENYSKLWDIYKRMSEYIDTRYELNNSDKISYPKAEAEYAERLNENWSKLKKGGNKWKTFKSIMSESLHEYKGFFYEKGVHKDYSGAVNPNYYDKSKIEINEKTRVYQLKGYSYKDAKAKATGEILSTYSTDLDRNFKALLLEAALHDTRLTVEPIAKAILERHKNLNTIDGKTRENSIKRLEYFIEKIVLNQSVKERGTNSIAGKNLSEDSMLNKFLSYIQKIPVLKNFLQKQSTRFLSDKEKELLEHFKELKGKPFSLENFKLSDGDYKLQVLTTEEEEGKKETDYVINGEIVSKEKFEKKYQEYIDYKIKETGLDLNLAGLIDGILKTIILKGLGINPISGVFNRVEGMHTVMIMDMTGEYWTPGNADIAKEFLAFANTMNMSERFVKGKDKQRKKQLEIFQKFLSKLDVLQNKKDELQKSTEDSKDLVGWIYKWSVDDPEFKNQGSVILSVLMDEVIKDNNGVEYKLFDKETQSFTPFEINNDVLTIKENFKNSFKLDSEQMSRLVTKLESTVSHSQGNYNTYDIIMIKKHWWGRALMLFRTWFPEHIKQRWGVSNSDGELNINLSHNKQVRNGRFIEGYKASKGSFITYTAAALGISYAGYGLIGLAGVGIVGAYVYTKFLKKISSNDTIKKDSNSILEISQFLHSTLIESLNYPSRLLSSIPRVKNLRIDTTKNNFGDAYKNSTMSEREIQSLRAMSRELAIMVTSLTLKLAIGALTWDDDDDKDSPQRKRYNFIQNQLSRSITTLNSWSDPNALVTDNQRIGVISYLGNLMGLINNLIINPDMDKAKKSFWDATPIPRMITKNVQGNMPWEDNMDFDDKSSMGSYMPNPLKWVSESIKNFNSTDESKAKKEYSQYRKDLRTKLEEEYMDTTNGDKSKLKAIVDAQMLEQLGKKDKEESYVDVINKIKETGQLNTRDSREDIVNKLKEEGMSNDEIGDIMRDIYSGKEIEDNTNEDIEEGK
jgi:hypothetical protein